MNIKKLTESLNHAEQRIIDANEANDKELIQYWRGRADSYREMLTYEIEAQAVINRLVEESLAERAKPRKVRIPA